MMFAPCVIHACASRVLSSLHCCSVNGSVISDSRIALGMSVLVIVSSVSGITQLGLALYSTASEGGVSIISGVCDKSSDGVISIISSDVANLTHFVGLNVSIALCEYSSDLFGFLVTIRLFMYVFLMVESM